MSAKKNVFKASVLESPPSSDEVGVFGEGSAFEPSEKRLAYLAEVMNETSAELPQEDKKESAEERRIMALFPFAKEQVIRRDKLVPAPEEWNFFGRPSKEAYGLIVQSICKYGLWHPLTVWEQDGGKYMILGGHTRDIAFGDLYALTKDKKYLSVPCRVYAREGINETEARRIVILTNIAQRATESPRIRIRCYAEMAKLEREDAFYNDRHVDVGAAVARLFGVSRRSVFMTLSLTKLHPPLIDEMEKGNLTLTIAYEISRMEPELQKHLYEKGYFRKITPLVMKTIRKASNCTEIDKIFANLEHPEPVFRYGISLPVRKPRGFGVLPLLVKDGESDVVKDFLRKSLDSEAGTLLSDETREAIKKVLV